ncbi:hypothetical protein F966_01047 [Acinetobacter higginsii]|uniref:Uncharacterized protein n=1 Tax=Acinetobacter higginsii TaxID=70347 RepID=N8WH03_9GAMM|nr:hypothetical protein [Acinetobacter higginsii]ENV11256.1 hypothetical protein F966_01047 [Acinetobacter higginsii]
MSIQSFVYDFKQQLKSKQINLKTTHLYELIAAAFGHKSYSSLKLSTLPLYVHSLDQSFAIELLIKRCSELQLDEIVSKLLIEQLRGFNFVFKTQEECAELVRQALDNEEFENSNIFQQLQKSFEVYSDQSVYPYLIAQLYSDFEHDFFEDDSDMNYLYQRYLQGQEISSTWKPDLDRFIANKERNEYLRKNYINYLSKASRLGNFPAKYQLYKFLLDDYVNRNEDFVESSENSEQQLDSLTEMRLELARRGNEKALRDIFEQTVSADLEKFEVSLNSLKEECLMEAWKWQKFALFLGFDLAKGNYRTYGIDEYGNDYDDDIGGPIYVAEVGRKDIYLSPLPKEKEYLLDREVEQLIYFYRNLNEFVFDRYPSISSNVWSEDEWNDEEY